jgi:hypothetical protein
VLSVFGRIELISKPREHFKEDSDLVADITGLARNGFGSGMTQEDVFNHLVTPQNVLLGYDCEGRLGVMYAYSVLRPIKKQHLYVDGVVVRKDLQGRGLFPALTKLLKRDSQLLSLRTSSARMFESHYRVCGDTFVHSFPKNTNLQKEVFALAALLDMEVDENGVQKGFYPQSLYSKPQTVYGYDYLPKLGVDPEKGDAILVVGK